MKRSLLPRSWSQPGPGLWQGGSTCKIFYVNQVSYQTKIKTNNKTTKRQRRGDASCKGGREWRPLDKIWPSEHDATLSTRLQEGGTSTGVVTHALNAGAINDVWAARNTHTHIYTVHVRERPQSNLTKENVQKLCLFLSMLACLYICDEK